jgi:hypothetical protein
LDEKKSFDERSQIVWSARAQVEQHSPHERRIHSVMVSFREALGSEEIDGLARGGTRERRGRGERGGGLLEEGWEGWAGLGIL